MIRIVSGCSGPRTLCEYDKTRRPISAASVYLSWWPRSQDRLLRLERVYGCSTPRTFSRIDNTRRSISSASLYLFCPAMLLARLFRLFRVLGCSIFRELFLESILHVGLDLLPLCNFPARRYSLRYCLGF